MILRILNRINFVIIFLFLSISFSNANFKEIDIGNNLEIREEMIKRSNGRRTVPQIFIEDKHIGGYEELRALEKNGELKNILGN